MIVGGFHLPTSWADQDQFAGALDAAMAALHRLREASPIAEVCLGVDWNLDLDLDGYRDPERFELLESHLMLARLALRSPGRPTCHGVVLDGVVTTERFGGACRTPSSDVGPQRPHRGRSTAQGVAAGRSVARRA